MTVMISVEMRLYIVENSSNFSTSDKTVYGVSEIKLLIASAIVPKIKPCKALSYGLSFS